MSATDKWYSEIENKYRSFFANRLKNAMVEYDFSFPVEDTNAIPTHFPTVFFSEISQGEIGSDLDGANINAVKETVEIKVFTNSTLSEIKQITAETVAQMKKLRFSVRSAPIYSKEGENVRRSVARYMRVIGQDDSVM